jgi:hypothetical protein
MLQKSYKQKMEKKRGRTGVRTRERAKERERGIAEWTQVMEIYVRVRYRL